MKRKDEMELRRAVRAELRHRQHARQFSVDGESRWRVAGALFVATKHGNLSPEATTFLDSTRRAMEEAAHARLAHEQAYDKSLDSLALLLGVR